MEAMRKEMEKYEEMEAMKKEKELFFVCYMLDINYSLNINIHGIDLNLGHYLCEIVDIYKKNQGKLSPD